MQVLTAREITQIPRLSTGGSVSVWGLMDAEYEVVFDDGVKRLMPRKHLIFNRYCWELFLLYPTAGIRSDCDVTDVIGKDYFNADTHIKLLERIFRSICLECGLTSYTSKHPLLKKIYQVIDYLHNELINMISPSVTTINAVDFIEVVKSEEIMGVHANLRSTPEGVEKAYKDIKRYVSNAAGRNRFVQAYRAKAINENQSNQCIGPRGFVTDLDRTVFRQPIASGFIKGMSSLYEMMTESCTAAKSLNANGTHIQTSEYTSRRIQLLAMVVQNVVNGDCGSQEYMDIFITPQVLENLKGIYYLKEDNTLGCLVGDETHLHGQIIKIRTALGCRHEDPSKICSTCLGGISQNFAESTNLGYTMAAFLMEKVTQAILSTKHLTHSVRKSLIQLEGLANKYFYTDENGDLYFHKDLDLRGLQLILPNASVGRLVDVLSLPHTNIGLSKIGELDSVAIKAATLAVPTVDRLNISYKDRNCIITKALLKHIKSVSMEADSRGNFVIPLDTFDKSNPPFNNPLKETNIINFVTRTASIIETSKEKENDPYEKLNTLFAAVTDKFKCNLSVLQVLVYATTAYNASQGNYSLGRNSPTATCENKYTLFRYRDFAGLAVYEKQTAEIIDHPTVTFSSKLPRQSHPMGVFLTPQHIVK